MQALLLLAALLQGPCSSTAPVVINEFLYDHTGTDDQEFVELYNRSGAPVDIGGWTLAAADPTTTNPSYAIPAGTILAAGDYYVLGSALVANVDQIVGTTNLWENDNESLTLLDGVGAVVDTLVYESAKGIWSPALAEGPGVYGNQTATLSPVVPMAWSRARDGYDTNNNGYDFVQLPRTPGASNELPDVLPVLDNFDAGTPGTSISGWEGSFVTPRYADPTVVDSTNPNSIPSSPQGGNAAIFWDPSGGGNAGPLLSAAGNHFDFECYIYLESAPHPVSTIDQWETTSFGVGTSDTFGNHPDPGGALSGMGVTGIVEASTGVAWTYVRFTDLGTGLATTTLYLVDYNDGGGSGTTVLGSIPIVGGGNDGWQRLRLRVDGAKVEGWFGGTIGLNDGTKITGTTAQAVVGPFYFQYRELVTMNASVRPPTIDDLRIRRHGPGIDPVVPPSACIGSGGVDPHIGWDGGTPLAMTAGPYAVTLSDAFSPGSAILVIGVTSGVPFPLDLAFVVGGNPGLCFTLNDPLVLVVVPVAGTGPCLGTATVPVSLGGVPPGGPVFAHWILFDPGSSLGFPLTASDGIALTVQ